jgi:hypothetical protein
LAGLLNSGEYEGHKVLVMITDKDNQMVAEMDNLMMRDYQTTKPEPDLNSELIETVQEDREEDKQKI